MPSDTKLSHQEQKWRSDFQSRLKKATDFLQGNKPIARTQTRHLEDFAQVLSKEPLYRKEVENLTTFELETLCIASTKIQATRDAEFFMASELRSALSCGFVNAKRRNEVRTEISNDPYLKRMYHRIQTNGSKIALKCRYGCH